MVIISTAICSKAGKILVARQYKNITRQTLEDYIRNFPKLITANQQHTSVENDNVRYIYLPLETTMYVVLITTKNSNIIEDLETIRFVHKIVADVCLCGISELTVQQNALNLLLAFDDVISSGYRENANLNQIQNSLEMESSDEKLHLMRLKAQINEANEAANKARLQINKRKKDSTQKFESVSSSSASSSQITNKKNIEPEVVVNVQAKNEGPLNKSKGNEIPKKGLQIVKKKESKKLDNAIVGENVKDINMMLNDSEKDKKEIDYNPLKAPVSVEFEEKLICQMQKDGAVSNFEIKGELFLLVKDPTKGNCAVYLEPEANNKAISLKPTPSFNRQKWTESFALAPKDLKDSFNAGQKINCLKYRYASTSMNDVPFRFNYWFNEGTITCEIEFNEAQDRIHALENLVIFFDFPPSELPQVKNVENADFQIDKADNIFKWIVPKLDESNGTSNIEVIFSYKTTPEDLFPFNVDFRLDYNFYKLNIKRASLISDDTVIACDFKSSLAVEKFEIA